jgi:hypothetical protein
MIKNPVTPLLRRRLLVTFGEADRITAALVARCASDVLGADYLAEQLTDGDEADLEVEALGTARAFLPEDGDPVLAAASGFLGDGVDGEPAHPATLGGGRHVQSPDAAAERFLLVVGGSKLPITKPAQPPSGRWP